MWEFLGAVALKLLDLLPLLKAVWLAPTEIVLPTATIQREKIQFRWGLLHVRDGNERTPECGPLRNTIRWFRPDKSGRLRCTVWHRRNWGFQFKCFVDCQVDTDLEETKRSLGAMGFREPTASAGVKHRVFFLLPHFEIVETPDKKKNNYWLPV